MRLIVEPEVEHELVPKIRDVRIVPFGRVVSCRVQILMHEALPEFMRLVVLDRDDGFRAGNMQLSFLVLRNEVGVMQDSSEYLANIRILNR